MLSFRLSRRVAELASSLSDMAPSAMTSSTSTRSERSSSLPDASQEKVKLRLYCYDQQDAGLVLALNVRITVPANISYADLVFRCNEKFGKACSVQYHAPADPLPSPHDPLEGANLIDVKDDEDVQNMVEDFLDANVPMLLVYLFPADIQGLTEEEQEDFEKFLNENCRQGEVQVEEDQGMQHTSRDSSFSECPALSGTPTATAQASSDSPRGVLRARRMPGGLAMVPSTEDMVSADGLTSPLAVGDLLSPPRTQDSWFCQESLHRSLFQDVGADDHLPSHISAFGDPGLDVKLPDHISVFGSPGTAFGFAGQPGAGDSAMYQGSVGQLQRPASQEGPVPMPTSPQPIHQVAKSEVKVLGTIGEGAFGEVSLAVCPLFGKVAVKWLKPEKVERHAGSFWQEATLLARLNHPNVLRFYGVVVERPPEDRQVVGIMTEFVRGGSLSQVLKVVQYLSLRKRAELALGAVNGLAYLHEQQIVHFDLKPDNLLVDGAHTIKVADFGLSKAKYQAYVSSIRDLRGTLPYMAPELLADPEHVTEKADVWSIGMVLWEMLTLEVPFAKLSPQHIISGLMRGSLQADIPDWCEPEWRGLMEKCWEVNPAARPACRDLAFHLEQILERCDLLGLP